MFKLYVPVVVGFCLVITVFVLVSFFSGAIAGSLFFPLVLGLGVLGGLCILMPMLYQVMEKSRLAHSNKWAGLGLAVAMCLMAGIIWGGFLAGVLMANPVFFMVSFGLFFLISIVRIGYIIGFVRYSYDQAKHIRAKVIFVCGCLLFQVSFVLLGLHLTGLWALSSVGLCAVQVGVIGSLALACLSAGSSMFLLDKAEIWVEEEPIVEWRRSERIPGIDMACALDYALHLTAIEAHVSNVTIAVTNKIVAAYQSSRGVSSSV